MPSKSSGFLGGLFGPNKAAGQPVSASNPYHAVSILPGVSACASAYRFAGQRFLSREAPRLPLPSCDARTCGCCYKHHKDRRAGPRRHSDVGLISAPGPSKERRQSRGRRAEDQF
jgi:hypothetical protein